MLLSRPFDGFGTLEVKWISAMKQPSTVGPVALAALLVITMTAAACGHASPAAPDAGTAHAATALMALSPTLAAAPGSSATATAAVTFPLSAGTFTITGRKATQISGVYTGETSVSNGVSTTTLRLEVQGGTGGLAGAAGVLEGKGTGAFTGEGKFSLLVSGFLSTAEKKKSKFTASLQGSSTISCDSGQVIVSLHADGPDDTKSGAEMRHVVGNAGCGF
jgi:hypothetical protein